VAFGAEFGGAGGTVRRWTGEIRVRVHGSPSAEDLETLATVIAELDELTGSLVLRTVQDDSANFNVHFVPQSEFSMHEPRAADLQRTNKGLIFTDGDPTVLIATDLEPIYRSHLIREEFTQGLGMLRDSHRYPESIFYQEWTSVTAYAPIDRAVIRMVYNPAIREGMTKEEARATLAQR
jgi:hypothetical protein